MAAIGHGERTDIDPAEALDTARDAEPAEPRPSQPQDGDPQPGETARVRPGDNAKDWVEGEVSFIDAHEIALLRDDPRVGRSRRALSAAGLRLAAGLNAHRHAVSTVGARRAANPSDPAGTKWPWSMKSSDVKSCGAMST